jgi:predicted double-glycine peptidase
MSTFVNARLGSVVRRLAGVVGIVSVSVTLAGVAAADPSAVPSPTPGVYGDPAAAARYWGAQTYGDDCGLMSVADVVGQVTGKKPTEQEMITLAERTPSAGQSGPIYNGPDKDDPETGGEGISMSDLVLLLDHYGIKATLTDTTQADQVGLDTGLNALEQYLSDGRKIIAYVNSEILWASSEGQRKAGDHFLVVTGVNTNTGYVHLNDSGVDPGADEQVDLQKFLKAWKTGQESMIVTAAGAR